MCKHARACMQSVFGLYVPMLQGLMLVRRLHGRSCPGVHEGELVSLHFGAILRTHSKGALKAPSCKLQLQQLWTAAACPQLLLSPPLPFSTVAFKVSVCISWPPVYPDYCRELSMLDGDKAANAGRGHRQQLDPPWIVVVRGAVGPRLREVDGPHRCHLRS